ncbi:MAG: flagellar motor switch protein FliN, partial [Lachnospira sp.]|nr:flagellar motor switch protein FliN [Lachnospira sp.]
IGDLIDSEIMQLYPTDFAKELIELFVPADMMEEASNPTPAPAPAPAQQAAPTPAPVPQEAPAPAPMPQMQPDPNAMPYGYPPMGMPPYGYGMPPFGYAPQMQPVQPDVNVSPAAFQPFASDLSALTQKENIDLIMDVPLEVTVELGRTSKSIKDILEFAPGTIVELNKIAGEAIDVLVNGKYVAKGEVVVIEESFGVRITEIIKDK